MHLNQTTACSAPHSSSARHKEPSQVLVSTLRNLPQCLFASGRAFLGTTPNQAAKSRPLRTAAPLPIVAMIAVAVTGPTPGIATSLRQDSFSRTILRIDLSARSIFSASCSSSGFSSASNTSTAPGSSGITACNYARQCFIHVAPALAQCRATLKQKPTNLVDHRRSSHHPAFTDPMQRLEVQLVIALDRHKTHGRSSHRFGDRFRVDVVYPSEQSHG